MIISLLYMNWFQFFRNLLHQVKLITVLINVTHTSQPLILIHFDFIARWEINCKRSRTGKQTFGIRKLLSGRSGISRWWCAKRLSSTSQVRYVQMFDEHSQQGRRRQRTTIPIFEDSNTLWYERVFKCGLARVHGTRIYVWSRSQTKAKTYWYSFEHYGLQPRVYDGRNWWIVHFPCEAVESTGKWVASWQGFVWQNFWVFDNSRFGASGRETASFAWHLKNRRVAGILKRDNFGTCYRSKIVSRVYWK